MNAQPPPARDHSRLTFIVLDVAGQGGPAALPVVAHVIAFVAAGWIALAVLRRPPIG